MHAHDGAGQWLIATPESFPEGELNAQSICDFFNSPLISDQIAGRRNYCRLPPISMIFANLDFYLSLAQKRNDHVRQLLGRSEFLGIGSSPKF